MCSIRIHSIFSNETPRKKLALKIYILHLYNTTLPLFSIKNFPIFPKPEKEQHWKLFLIDSHTRTTHSSSVERSLYRLIFTSVILIHYQYKKLLIVLFDFFFLFFWLYVELKKISSGLVLEIQTTNNAAYTYTWKKMYICT